MTSETSTVARSAAERLVFGGLLVVLLWLPLPWGSHRVWATDLFVTCAALLLLTQLTLLASGAAGLPARFGRLLIAPALWWLVWLCWIGWQVVPLDLTILSTLSPAAAKLVTESAGVLGVDPVPRISIAPAATMDAWMLSAGYAALYLLTMLSCAGDERRIARVLGVIVVSSTVQAVYAGLMLLSGLEWGFFAEKDAYRGVATGTFVNRNHLAGYLALGAAAALGLILSEIGSGNRAGGARNRILGLISLLFSAKMRARLALIMMVIALILTRSRMGNTAFFASMCVCAVGFMLLRHRRYVLRTLLLFASIVLIDLLIVSNWYGLERVVDSIEQTDLATENRATLLGEAQHTMETYAKVGSGLGTFAMAHAPFRRSSSWTYFDHAHNDYVQFLIETGAIGLGLLGVFVLGHVLHAIRVLLARRRRSAAAATFAALMAMLAQAIHATADFNLQIPANAASLLVLMAMAASWSGTSRRRRRSGNRVDDEPWQIAYTEAASPSTGTGVGGPQ
jgi:O-antigen ligase